MNMIFNSSQFCVVEFSGFDDGAKHPAGGYEIMDKSLRREIFLGGRDAEQFRDSVQKLIADQPSVDDIDDFLARYSGLMTTQLVLH